MTIAAGAAVTIPEQRGPLFSTAAAHVPRHVSTWTVRIDVFESSSSSRAHAVLETDGDSRPIEGYGRAAHLGCDALVPEITDEVAVARALQDLADRLRDAADLDRGELAARLARHAG